MNNEELSRKVAELERRLEAAERWIRERQRQQISQPLDEASKQIIRSI